MDPAASHRLTSPWAPARRREPQPAWVTKRMGALIVIGANLTPRSPHTESLIALHPSEETAKGRAREGRLGRGRGRGRGQTCGVMAGCRPHAAFGNGASADTRGMPPCAMTVGAVLSVEATGQLPAVPHHGPPCQHARKKRRGPSDRRRVRQALSGGGALAERRPRTGRDIQAITRLTLSPTPVTRAVDKLCAARPRYREDSESGHPIVS